MIIKGFFIVLISLSGRLAYSIHQVSSPFRSCQIFHDPN